jgi:hypothetical protein
LYWYWFLFKGEVNSIKADALATLVEFQFKVPHLLT